MTEPDGEWVVDGAGAVRRLVVAMLAVQGALLVVDLLFAYLDLVPGKAFQHLANVAREDGFATWYSATQATAVAAVLGAVAWAEGRAGRGRLGWALLALLFAYIGADDATGLHERIGPAVRHLSGGAVFDLVPSYAWQVVFVPLFGAAGLGMVLFLRHHLAPALQLGILLALAGYAVAVGLDFVEGVDGAHERLADALHLGHYTVSHAARVLEEELEMAATTLFLAVFASKLVRTVTPFRLRVG
ncbi:MAG: hypothetical protein R3F59_25420 [Myxococcota bacterium]